MAQDKLARYNELAAMADEDQTDEEIDEQVNLYYELFHAEQEMQALDTQTDPTGWVWPCNICDNLQDANVNWHGIPANCEGCSRYICDNHGGVDAQGNVWCEICSKTQDITLMEDDEYERYLKSSIDPREIEGEKFYTFEIKGKETKELIAVVIYNCTSEQEARGRVEEDAAGDIYELVKVEPVI